jgi:hypothetical protein
VWHASIALLDKKGRPIQVKHVVNKKAGRSIGEGLLFGVGTGETYYKEGEIAIHVRRSLSEEEIAGLDPVWLAIPAVDMAG